jgi:CubicO group peptidase (beta-lactamase class C family)
MIAIVQNKINEPRNRVRLLKHIPLSAFLLVLFLAVPAMAELPGLANWMQSLVDEGKVVGCSAQVTQGGETIFLEAFGDRTPESDEDLHTNQIVRIYSMSKAITSTAIMQLVDQGKLGIDDPVAMYIPEFADMTVGLGNDAHPAHRQITIRDLLTHTSGLAYDFSAPEEYKAVYEEVFKDTTTLESAGAAMGSLPLVSEVGERFVYGVNTDVLGRVVEVVSGISFEDYLRRHIFGPLKMRHTGFTPPTDLKPMHIVNGEPGVLKVDSAHYAREDSRALRPRFQSGGGGLWSTLGDYTRFMQAMERQGELDGVRILKAKTVKFMTQNHLSPAYPGHQRFGLGFGLMDPVVTSVGPRGGGRWTWGGAASTYFFIDPQQDLTAIFVTQKFPFDGPLGEGFHKAVLEAVAVEPALITN